MTHAYRQGYEAGREKGQEEGAKGKFFSSVEITEPLPKDIYDKIFQAGREAERERFQQRVDDVLKNEFEWDTDDYVRYEGRPHIIRQALNAPEGEERMTKNIDSALKAIAKNKQLEKDYEHLRCGDCNTWLHEVGEINGTKVRQCIECKNIKIS